MITHFQKVLRYLLTGFLAGLVYPLFGDEWGDYLAVINGMSIGIVGSTFIGLLEVYVFDEYWRRKNFGLMALSKTIIYTSILAITVVLVKGFNDSLYLGIGLWEYISSQQFHHFLFKEDLDLIILYALSIIGLITVGNMISLKMGPGVLKNIISGKYHRPNSEDIVLMVIDLKSSTEITEQLGAEKYHSFINKFYHDIAKCIVVARGKIYRYVGDQLTIYWNSKDLKDYTDLIDLYFQIENELTQRKEEYIQLFGYCPAFRATAHTGELVVGEIGDVKSQIVFHGPALYICEMMEKKCKELGEDFLLSEAILNGAALPNDIYTKKVDTIKNSTFREIDVYSVTCA